EQAEFLRLWSLEHLERALEQLPADVERPRRGGGVALFQPLLEFVQGWIEQAQNHSGPSARASVRKRSRSSRAHIPQSTTTLHRSASRRVAISHWISCTGQRRLPGCWRTLRRSTSPERCG